MKLDKSQRHTAYIIAEAELPNYGYYGLCHLFDNVFDIELDNDYYFGNLKSLFPELWRERATGKGDTNAYLWDDDEQRRKALRNCIKKTAQ
jgi:hypothetical protein